MNPALHLVLLALWSIIFLDGSRAVMEEKPCPAVVQGLTKKQLGGIAACTKSLKFKDNKDKAKKMTCVMKCVLKKEDFLTENGQYTDEQFEKFREKHFPPSMYEKANSTFKPCIEGGTFDDADEFCKDYDPLIKCLLNNFPNMCK